MIVAFHGRSKSGKNTAANMWNFIVNGYDFKDYYWASKGSYYEFENSQESIVPDIKILGILHQVITSTVPSKSLQLQAFNKVTLYNKKYFELVGFADAVKKAASIITNQPLAFFYDEQVKETVMPALNREFTYRSFLQKFAEEACRQNLNKNIWVECLLGNYTPLRNLAIYDLRYDNEAEAVKNLNGIIIKLERNTNSVDFHPSESGIDSDYVDYTIFNNGSLEDLYNSLKEAHLTFFNET